MLSDIVKKQVEQALQEILYEDPTLEKIDSTLEAIRAIVDESTPGALGNNCFVSYISSKNHVLKFAITHRDSKDQEYVVDVVTLSGAGWDENKKNTQDPDDQDDTGK